MRRTCRGGEAHPFIAERLSIADKCHHQCSWCRSGDRRGHTHPKGSGPCDLQFKRNRTHFTFLDLRPVLVYSQGPSPSPKQKQSSDVGPRVSARGQPRETRSLPQVGMNCSHNFNHGGTSGSLTEFSLAAHRVTSRPSHGYFVRHTRYIGYLHKFQWR